MKKKQPIHTAQPNKVEALRKSSTPVEAERKQTSLEWNNLESLKNWAEGFECRKIDLSFLNFNANNLDIFSDQQSIKLYNYIEKAMRIRALMHELKNHENISELEKYLYEAQSNKKIFLFEKASFSELFGSNLPEEPCVNNDAILRKVYRDSLSVNSLVAKMYAKDVLKGNYKLIDQCERAVLDDLVNSRIKLTKLKYEKEVGHQISDNLLLIVKRMHEHAVQKYIYLPNWYSGFGGETKPKEGITLSHVDLGIKEVHSTLRSILRLPSISFASSLSSPSVGSRLVPTPSRLVASRLVPSTSLPSTSVGTEVPSTSVAPPLRISNVKGKGKAKIENFASISVAIPFEWESKTAHRPIEKVESQFFMGVPPPRPEALPNPARNWEVPGTGFLFLIGAFIVGTFYRFKKRKP